MATPVVNQFQLHVGMGQDPEGLVSFCKDNNITVQAYSPLAAGGVVTDPLCSDIAKKNGKSSAQVGLRWILQNQHAPPQGPAIVVKASNPDYLKEDLDIFNWSLPSDDMSKLNAATVRILFISLAILFTPLAILFTIFNFAGTQGPTRWKVKSIIF